MISYSIQERVQEVLSEIGRDDKEFFTELMEAYHYVRHNKLCSWLSIIPLVENLDLQ